MEIHSSINSYICINIFDRVTYKKMCLALEGIMLTIN